MSQKMSQKRASNYSSEEIEILIHEVRKQKKMLFASFNNNVTNQKKTDIWKDIAAKLNAVSGVTRQYSQIKHDVRVANDLRHL